MLILFQYFFFCKKAEEEVIKANRTPVSIETLIHIINDPNRNMSEEVNVKARKSLPVAHQFVCNYILLCMSRKYTNPLFSKVVS